MSSKVYIGNNFIEAGYSCTTIEKKILNTAILKANKQEFPLKPNPHKAYLVTINRKDLLNITGLDTDRDFRHIKYACETLNQKVLIYVNEDGKEFITSSFITETQLKNGVLKLYFNGRIIPFFNNLKKCFTSYDLLKTRQFKCKYTIRLFELIKQYEKFGKRTIKIEQFKKMFQLQNKYSRYSDFRINVIEKPRKELKEKSDLYFDYIQNKIGKNVISISMTIKLNNLKIDRKYYLKRVNDYLANQSITDFYSDLTKYFKANSETFTLSDKQAIHNLIIKKSDPKILSESVLYHYFKWYDLT